MTKQINTKLRVKELWKLQTKTWEMENFCSILNLTNLTNLTKKVKLKQRPFERFKVDESKTGQQVKRFTPKILRKIEICLSV